MSKIGKNIAQRRKALGMTQEELAKRMGYKSKSTINKIELGINDVVQSKIVKFAEVLETTPSVLMGWQEEIKRNPEEMAERHFQIITDADISEMFDDFKLLDEAQRKIVKELVHNLAQTKKSEA